MNVTPFETQHIGGAFLFKPQINSLQEWLLFSIDMSLTYSIEWLPIIPYIISFAVKKPEASIAARFDYARFT